MANSPLTRACAIGSVLVSGGASGIGEKIVEAFAQQNARVFFLDIEDEAARAVIESCEAKGFSPADLSTLRCDRYHRAAAMRRERGEFLRNDQCAGE